MSQADEDIKGSNMEAEALQAAVSEAPGQSCPRQAPSEALRTSPVHLRPPSTKPVNNYLQLENAHCLLLAMAFSSFPLCFYAVGDLDEKIIITIICSIRTNHYENYRTSNRRDSWHSTC